MADCVVSDVVERLLAHFPHWHDHEDCISHCFGGRNKLKQVEETLRMIQGRLADAEGPQDDEDRAAAVKEWLGRLKCVLYQMEELFEEAGVAEREKEEIQLQIPGDRKVEYVPVTRISTLIIDRCQELVSMIVESPIHLEYFEVRRCGSIKEIFCQELTIERLEVEECDDLHLWDDKEGGNNRITVIEGLESLKLCNISKLQALPRGLASLTMLQRLCISKLPNLRALPEWIQHLSQLQDLEIAKCSKLTALPESFRELMSLQKFEIRQCNPELKNRCEKATGEDWPKIQHIPTVLIKP